MKPIPDTYDHLIRPQAQARLPYDWRILKAQLWQESRFNPQAVSPVGARGLAQFMPKTWAMAMRALDLEAQPQDVEAAIQAAAWYMRQLWDAWTAPRPEGDRISLALASYNAGLGNLLKAQRVAGGVNDYASIVHALPQITGQHARETQAYVPAIWGHYVRLVVDGG